MAPESLASSQTSPNSQHVSVQTSTNKQPVSVFKNKNKKWKPKPPSQSTTNVSSPKKSQTKRNYAPKAPLPYSLQALNYKEITKLGPLDDISEEDDDTSIPSA